MLFTAPPPFIVGLLVVTISSPTFRIEFLALCLCGPGGYDDADVTLPPGSVRAGCLATEFFGINAERAPWDSDPLVWAITFKRIEP
jgi:hypothetical protein